MSSPLALRENVEPAHNTNSHFSPTYRKVVNLPGLLKTKRLNEMVENKVERNSEQKRMKNGCNQCKENGPGSTVSLVVSLQTENDVKG